MAAVSFRVDVTDRVVEFSPWNGCAAFDVPFDQFVGGAARFRAAFYLRELRRPETRGRPWQREEWVAWLAARDLLLEEGLVADDGEVPSLAWPASGRCGTREG